MIVRAPGYASRTISVLPAGGGETLVTMVRGGDIEVIVRGDLADAQAEVRLWDPINRRRGLVASAPLDDDRHVGFEGLPVGTLTAQVELGERWWTNSRRVAGTSMVDVEAGRTAVVQVDVEPVPVVTPVPFRGVVRIPRDYTARSYSMIAVLDSPPLTADGGREMELSLSPRSDATREWAFDAGLVEPGTYLVRVDPIRFATLVEVPPGGNVQTRIDVPPTATVLVRAVDAATAETLDPDRLTVFWRVTSQLRSGPGSRRRRAEETLPSRSAVRLTAPATRIDVDIEYDGYGYRRVRLSLEPGENDDVEVQLRRVTALTVNLRDGDRIIPWPAGVRAWLMPLEGQRTRGITYGARRAWFEDVELGRYRLVVDPLPDYAPLDPREVAVEAGPIGDVIFDLKRLW